jgi:hypothetical protein
VPVASHSGSQLPRSRSCCCRSLMNVAHAARGGASWRG